MDKKEVARFVGVLFLIFVGVLFCLWCVAVGSDLIQTGKRLDVIEKKLGIEEHKWRK